MSGEFPSQKQLERLRARYPEGSRIELEYMDDPCPVPPGTKGTVQYVDDSGNFFVARDSGRSLPVFSGVDSFHTIQQEQKMGDIQPRYGVWENVPGAFSSGEPKGEDFRIVLEEFLRIGCDTVYVPGPYTGRWEPAGRILLGDTFSLAWKCVDAQYWPAPPQRRRRIYLVVDFGGATAPQILFEQESLSRNYSACVRTG